MRVFAISVLSLDVLVLLVRQAPLIWCADGDDGPSSTAEEGEKAFLCPWHIVQQTTFSTLLYDLTHKNKIQLSTLYRKVSFGQPARQESVNLIVTRHWKTITCQKTCFQDLIFQQHNGIAKSAALHVRTENCWRKAKWLIGVSAIASFGFCHICLWMFDETDNHHHRWEGGSGRLSYVAVTG